MSDLPQGWSEAAVTEIAKLHDSRRVPLNAKQRAGMQGSFPYYGANGLVDHINDYLFDGHYVLLAEDGGYFDDPARDVAYEASGKFWVNNHAHILEPLDAIPPRYLRHQLNAINWMPFVGGSTRLKLTQGGLERACMPVPPLPEQRRIVAKIDSLTGISRHARDHFDHIRARLAASSLLAFASKAAGQQWLPCARWSGLSDARLAQYDATLPGEWEAARPMLAEAIRHLKQVRDNIDLCLAELKRVLT